MKTEAIKTQFKQAEEDLKRAKGELYQPMEDVVSYCVCVSARSALYRYLFTLYLYLSEGEPEVPRDDLTLEELIKLCSKKSDSVGKLNFDNINCKHLDVRKSDEIYYCNDVEIVNHCTELAEQVREHLLDHLPPEFEADLTAF